MAQRERNYIYLLDCTKSMSGYNGAPNIWEPTKNYLRSDIERQTPNTSIHVVPFQGKNLPTFSFMANKFAWKDMEKILDGYMGNITKTNICDAWDLSSKYIDCNKDNYIYLLTDGVDNVKGTEALAKKLANFCGKHKNTHAFYVVLTKNAIDPKIKEIVENCPDECFVDVSKKLNPFGCFDDSTTIYANILNLKRKHKLQFSAAGKFSAKAVCNDPYFSVSIEGGKIENGTLSVKINAKKDIQQLNAQLPDTYTFPFDVKAKGVDIINPTIQVVMTNKPERELEIINEEQDMGEAEWYDSFLFCGAKESDTLYVDLKAIFNEEAKKDGSSFCVKVTDNEGLKDYKLLFNGEEIADGIIRFDAKQMPEKTLLGIVFNPDAKEGKHYLNIKANCKTELERVNGIPAEQYEVSLRSSYDVVWNPLKTFLFWLLIAIITALLIWFVILKHIIYPTFGTSSVMITDPYYSNIKIKGARKMIFSNKQLEQSTLNKIFTGKIICNVNPCWSQPLILEPAKMRNVRVVRTKTYVFNPYSSHLKPHTDYVVENTETNEKIKMTIN